MIRKAVASDLADVERIAAQAFAPYVERIGANPAPMDADYAGPIARECTWVAVSGTAVAGFCVVIPEDGSMLLDVVAVAGDSRGQGLGRQLIAFAEDLARAAGRPELRHYTHETMVENQAL